MTVGDAIDKILSVGISEADYSRFYFRNVNNAETALDHISKVMGADVTKKDLDAEMTERARRSLDRLSNA